MFDGNFRSRREINLSSGGRRRSRTDSGPAGNAQALRKERLARQRKDRAARLVQRCTRGWLTRLQVLQQCLSLDPTSAAATSLCLSLRPWFRKYSTNPQHVLLNYAKCLPKTADVSKEEDQMDTRNDGKATCSVPSAWFSHTRILQNTLELFRPSETDAVVLQSMFAILAEHQSCAKWDEALFMDLVECVASWCEGRPQHEMTIQLCQWCRNISQQVCYPYSWALVATAVPTLRDGDTTWIVPLAQIVAEDEGNVDNSKSLIRSAALNNLHSSRGSHLLSSVLDHSTNLRGNGVLLQLVHYLVTRNDAEEVSVIASLLARGDSMASTPTASANHSDPWEDSDSDDEMEDNYANQPRHQFSRTRIAARYARKDLLTLPKLDKLYQDQVQQRRKNCNLTRASTNNTAKKLVEAPWLEWGLQWLEAGNDNVEAAKRYVACLGVLLQATTSLRPRNKVGALSPLAFSRLFMQKLWNFAISELGSAEALGVFCDLFAHYLVALSDADFLQYHTTVSPTHGAITPGAAVGGDIVKGVLATDVIVHLRDVLYQLYWMRPVLASEVTVNQPRGRLLLAGTKVWNSLHERWNRLARTHSFCDESSWWFPRMSSPEGVGDVVSAPHYVDSMDIDGENQGEATVKETDALADAFRDPKMARVLTSIPQSLPFDRRVKLFNALLHADKDKLQGPAEMWLDGTVRERVKIRRAALYEDSMEQLNSLGSRIKHRIQVSFVNQHGAEEPGIDGGGVFKEFLDDLIKDGFAVKGEDESNTGAPPLFSVTPLQTLAVNFDLSLNSRMLIHYEFLGRVLGKAVYESILVEPQFCLPFLNQLLGKANAMDDLNNYDDEFSKNLNKLKLLNDKEVEALGLTFELSVGSHRTRGSNAPPRTVELKADGRNTQVRTKAHVFQYMHGVAHQLLNVQGARQTKAFLRGFRDLIPASWIRLFSANELQKLISGDDSIRGIDVPSLRKSMQYLGGYHPSQPYIQDFWDILEKDLTPEQQRKFLRFMTSCSRQPLLGFGSLEPVPAIQQLRLDESSKNSKLPTSQTCMNLLKLPNYGDKALLKEKLITAIESGAGFELT